MFIDCYTMNDDDQVSGGGAGLDRILFHSLKQKLTNQVNDELDYQENYDSDDNSLESENDDNDSDDNDATGEPMRSTSSSPGRAERANSEHPLWFQSLSSQSPASS